MNDTIETRACEVREDATVPRRLVGTVVTYGERARLRQFQEIIRPGAFGDVNDVDVVLNWQHQRAKPIARTGGGGLVLRDSPTRLELIAMVPETRDGDDVLELVRSKVLRSLSVEMVVSADDWQGNLRIIHRARLTGVSVVDSGAYEGSTVEARRGGGAGGGRGQFLEDFKDRKLVFSKAHGWISLRTALSCECRGGSAEQVIFEEGAFADIIEGKQHVMAITGGGFENAIASTVKETLRFTQTKGRVTYELDLPDTQITRDLLAQSEFVEFYGRPLITDEGSKSVVKDGIRHYETVNARALLLKPTHANGGWDPVTFRDPDVKREAPEPEKETKEVQQIWL